MAQSYEKLLRVMYWNARSVNQRKAELEKILVDYDLFVCVESWLTNDDKFEVSGFKTVNLNKMNTRGGGILYLIRNSLKYEVIHEITIQTKKVKLYTIHLANFDPSINIVTCYRIPGQILTQEEWNKIGNTTDHNINTILLGDFNAHNTKQNGKIIDTNGERLDYTLDVKNIYLHNANTVTHVDPRTGNTSNIDLILSTMAIADRIQLQACDETYGSDHFPLFFTIDVNTNSFNKKTFKITTKKTNWIKFQKNVEEKYDTFLTKDYDDLSPAQKYDYFVNIISESIKNATPKKSANKTYKKSNPVPWWDEECEK